MTQILQVHPETPPPNRILKAALVLADKGIAVVPTDTSYALMALASNKHGLERIARIRDLDLRKHLLSLVCADLSELSRYARVDNWAYRILKRFLPGPYTFVLTASSEVPRILLTKRKTIGLRIPDHPVPLALARAAGVPLLTTTLKLPGDEYPLNDVEEMARRLKGQVDLILDSGPGGLDVSSVVDLTTGAPAVIRQGVGDTSAFQATSDAGAGER